MKLAELNRYPMNKKNIVRFLHSLVMIPSIALAFPLNTVKVPEIPTAAVLSQKQNSGLSDSALSKKAEQEEHARKIDAYFADRNMPLEGYGMKMVIEAEKNDIDWRILPSIAVRESTGGKHACKRVQYNAFGWGGCTIGFKSTNEAIETVARNLGGNNPNTAKYYDGKPLRKILDTYNGLAVLAYADQVMGIMSVIEKYPVSITEDLALSDSKNNS